MRLSSAPKRPAGRRERQAASKNRTTDSKYGTILALELGQVHHERDAVTPERSRSKADREEANAEVRHVVNAELEAAAAAAELEQAKDE